MDENQPTQTTQSNCANAPLNCEMTSSFDLTILSDDVCADETNRIVCTYGPYQNDNADLFICLLDR
jgi:hypothetical protein